MKTRTIIPLAVPKELQREIRQASKETTLSQADVMRQSIRIGLPQFVRNYPKPDAPALILK